MLTSHCLGNTKELMRVAEDRKQGNAVLVRCADFQCCGEDWFGARCDFQPVMLAHGGAGA